MVLNLRKTGKIVEIPLVQIRPCKTQARKYYDAESLQALARSIRYNGILQPVTVRKVTAMEYELIAGERRLRAAALCGYTKIPCIIITCTDNQAEVLSLEENLQRADLNCFEEAEGIHQWMSREQLSPQDAARYLGKRPSAISERLKLLYLDDEEKELMIQAHLSERHAKAVLKVENKTDRRIVLSDIIERSMNISQSEQYVEDYIGQTLYERMRMQRRKGVLRDIRMFHNTVSKAVTALQVSGLAAETEQYDDGDCIEYVIRIPKTRTVSTEMTA